MEIARYIKSHQWGLLYYLLSVCSIILACIIRTTWASLPLGICVVFGLSIFFIGLLGLEYERAWNFAHRFFLQRKLIEVNNISVEKKWQVKKMTDLKKWQYDKICEAFSKGGTKTGQACWCPHSSIGRRGEGRQASKNLPKAKIQLGEISIAG